MLNNGWLSTDDWMQQKKYGAEWNKQKMRAKHSDNNNSSISKIEEELEMNEDVC